jgi:hypothetical protein
MTDETEKTGPLIKPLHAALAGPAVGISTAIGGLLLAPYVELHTAHHALLLGAILVLTIVVPAAVMCLSENRDEWSENREWPS